MSELIVPARLMIEGDQKCVYMSRVGVTCFNAEREQVSFVFSPKECSSTVVVQENVEMGMHFMCSHSFVGRVMDLLKIAPPYQVWRWHVDVYPAGDNEPMLYCPRIDTVVKQDRIYRTSFEHIAGPELANPYLLCMSFAAETIETVSFMRDLVPERQTYRESYESIYHPGLATMDMGILGQYELLVQREQGIENPKWLM
jgi:hypothetical protein